MSFSVESLVAPALAGPSRSAVAGRVGTPGLVERPRRRDRRAGFTLVEMLLVFALIAMFATLFVVNAGALMQQSAAQVVETRFWEAVREARSRAILDRVAHSVRFDDDATAFVVTNVRSGAERLYSINRDELPSDVELNIAFHKRVDRSQFTLVAGQLQDLREIPEVRFFPDGACVPFVVTLGIGATEREIEIDPWTGAELLADDAE